MGEPASLRLFFALWPDEPTMRRLAGLQQSLRPTWTGRWLRPENLHVTLVFLGQVPTGRLPELQSLAGQVQSPSFALVLDELQWWRGNRVLCLAPGTMPAGLGALVADLSAALESAGFELENRPYRAHLTLARQATTRDRSFGQPAPTELEATAFSLMVSRAMPGGSSYSTLGSWPLVTRSGVVTK